jgi:hypothetical protein
MYRFEHSIFSIGSYTVQGRPVERVKEKKEKERKREIE